MRGIQTNICLYFMHFTAFFSKPWKGIMRKQAQAEQRQEQNHHLYDNKLNLKQEEQGSSEA